jgi:hypothetical protein
VVAQWNSADRVCQPSWLHLTRFCAECLAASVQLHVCGSTGMVFDMLSTACLDWLERVTDESSLALP